MLSMINLSVWRLNICSLLHRRGWPVSLRKVSALKIKQLIAEKEPVPVLAIRPIATLQETAQKLIKHGIGALIVTDENSLLLGIVSERDLLHIIADFDPTLIDRPVSDVMTRSVITCGPDDEIADILRLMNSNAIRHMPVLEQGRIVNMVSIRELTKAYDMLQKEADTDPLTELANRRPFLKALDAEFSRAKRFKHPLAVAMIDIDHFKSVNDTYGHDAGDTVLRAMSAILATEFRTIDFIGRLGGEEFAVVFPETNLAGAKISCDRLLATIEAAIIPVDDIHIKITVSIGLAKASADTLDGKDILKRADELLYDAKNSGRNRVVVEEEQE